MRDSKDLLTDLAMLRGRESEMGIERCQAKNDEIKFIIESLIDPEKKGLWRVLDELWLVHLFTRRSG